MREITEASAERDNAALTPLLVTPRGRAEGARLVNNQGTALRELSEIGGGYFQLPVGEGKTLVTFLAPYVVEAKRPMLIVPPGLREDTWDKFQAYSRHWVSHNPPTRVLGYNEFTFDENVDLFAQLRPDFVMFDEADKTSNQGGSIAKRFDRYQVESGCGSLFVTGTGTRFSMHQMSHFLVWSLQAGAPWPLDPDESEAWAAAYDEKPAKFSFGPRGQRTRVGVLVDLAPIERQPNMLEQERARLALQKRLKSTPGVIISDKDSCDQPLTIELRCAPADAELDARFDFFRNEEQTPDEWDMVDSLDRYNHETQLGQGLYFRIDPRPPEEYVEARRACARFIRAKIDRTTHSKRPLDTPEAVKKAFRDHPLIVQWFDEYEPSLKLKSIPTWLSASVVHAAAKYAREHVCLVWSSFEVVGEAIAKAAGLKYYGPGGMSAEGGYIGRAPTDRSAVLSIAANLRGRNLQGFNDNYIVGMPPSARDCEQLLGREHRQGQKRPVNAVVLLTSGLSLYSFKMAKREAEFVRQTQGQSQKILRAKVTECAFPPSSALRWRTKEPAAREVLEVADGIELGFQKKAQPARNWRDEPNDLEGLGIGFNGMTKGLEG